MLDVSQDLRSLTDFQANTSEFLALLRQKDRDFVLTVDGRPGVAVRASTRSPT